MNEKRKAYMKQYLKTYNQVNKEKIRLQKKEKRNSSEENKQLCNRRTKNWLRNHPEYKLWKQARDSSKQRELEFTITQEDIIIPTHCPYLGIELTNFIDGGRQDSNISLDRIDNTKGYIKDNIQVISSKANFMKRNASIQELVTFARGVLKTHESTYLLA